jgi:CspA family cold shock protein
MPASNARKLARAAANAAQAPSQVSTTAPDHATINSSTSHADTPTAPPVTVVVATKLDRVDGNYSSNVNEMGVVLRWNDKGFGFIGPDGGGEEIFCHCKSIPSGMESLPQHTRVSFKRKHDPRAGKDRAEGVQVLEDDSGSGGDRRLGVAISNDQGAATTEWATKSAEPEAWAEEEPHSYRMSLEQHYRKRWRTGWEFLQSGKSRCTY